MKKFIIWPALVPALVLCQDEVTSVKLPYDQGTELNVPGTTETETPLVRHRVEPTEDDFLSAPLVQYTQADGTTEEGDDNYWNEFQRQYNPSEVDDEALDESDEKMSDSGN